MKASKPLNSPKSFLLLGAIIAAVIVGLPTAASAVTFQDWQSANFSSNELADPTISGMAANPTGDGSSNLLKYALKLDPHLNALSGLPINSLDEDGHLTLTFTRRKDTADLVYVPQVSNDLITWVTGTDFIEQVSTVDQGDSEQVTVRDLSSTTFEQKRFIRLFIGIDSDQDGLPDDWELAKFGTLAYGPNDDVDLDSFNNLYEYYHATDPTDYYNGNTPVVSIADGNNQTGEPDSLASNALVVLVTDTNSVPLANAPIVFSVSGDGMIFPTSGGAPTQSLTLRTDSTGHVSVYVKLPTAASSSNQVLAYAQTKGNPFVTFTESTNAGSNPSTLPPAATNVVGTFNQDGSVDMSWEIPEGDTFPKIVKLEQPDGTWKVVAVVPPGTTSYHIAAQ